MSGKLQLATKGIQNNWINGSPTKSHFLLNFKKHTKFAFDTLEIPVNEADYGKLSTCFIPLNAGDLITKMTLRYQLNWGTYEPRSYRDAFHLSVVEFGAIHLIEYADLYIGGVHIERLTSRWIQLNAKISYERSLYETNKYSTTFYTEGATRDDELTPVPVFVDLPFYFSDSMKSSILACKLQKQNCYIKIKFRELGDILKRPLESYLITDPDDPFGFIYYDERTDEENLRLLNQQIRISNVSILTKFAYLNREEVNFLKSRPIEQIITQLQLKRFDVPAGKTVRTKLNFKHPIKNLYFFVGSKNPVNRRPDDEDYNYGTNYMDNIKFTNAKLLFNNNIVFDDGPEKLIYYNAKLTTHGGMDLGRDIYELNKMDAGSYSFAMYPLKQKLSGHVNFSRIINQEFEITIPETEVVGNPSRPYIDPVNECQIYAVNYNILCYSDGLVGLKF